MEEVKSEKSRKFLYLGVFFVLIFIILAFFFLFRDKFFVQEYEKISESPSEKEIAEAAFIASGEKELNGCKSNFQNQYLALLNNDVSYCDKIVPNNFTQEYEKNEEAMKEECKMTIPLIDYYLSKISLDQCKNLPLLSVKSDYELCEKILKCFEMKDESSCDSSSFCKDLCSFLEANENKQILLCDRIVDFTTKAYCKIILSSNLDYASYESCDKGYERFIAEGNLSYFESPNN